MDASDRLADVRKRLRTPGNPHVPELAALVVEGALQRPFNHYLDASTAATLWTRICARENLDRIIARHGHAILARVLDQLASSNETVGHAVPEDTRLAILSLLGNPDGPRFGWLRGTLDPALLRELMTPVFREVLLGFVARVSASLGVQGAQDAQDAEGAHGRPGAGSARLFGRLGREVGVGTGRRLMEMGRNVMGGLGVDLQERIRTLAEDFSGAAAEAFRDALSARLKSKEGQAIVQALSRRGLEHVMGLELADIDTDLQRLPPSAVLELMPALWTHNVERELGQRILAEELSAWFEVEGNRSLGDWLADAGLSDSVRPLLTRQVTSQLKTLVESDAFDAWLTRLMGA